MHLQAIVCTTLSAHVHCVPSENACNAFTRHPAGAFFGSLRIEGNSDGSDLRPCTTFPLLRDEPLSHIELWAGCDTTASWYPRLADTACVIGMT